MQKACEPPRRAGGEVPNVPTLDGGRRVIVADIERLAKATAAIAARQANCDVEAALADDGRQTPPPLGALANNRALAR